MNVFLVDKDLQQANLLIEIFPGATLYYCYWHVKTYIRKVIATGYVTTQEKKDLKSAFDKLILSSDQQQFHELERRFLDMSAEVEIHLPNKLEPESLAAYYRRCWGNEPEKWALFHRQEDLFDCHGDRTTNRAESTFGHLKAHLASALGKKPASLTKVIPIMIRHLESQSESQQNRLKVIVPVCDGFNEELTEASFDLYDQAVRKYCKSLQAFKSVEFEKLTLGNVTVKASNGSRTYKTYETSCSCSFYDINRVPCHHILALREKLDLSLYDRTCFDDRYHRKLTDASFISDATADGSKLNSFAEFEFETELNIAHSPYANKSPKNRRKAKSPRKKYTEMLRLCQKISADASNHGQKVFEAYMDSLISIHHAISNGQMFTVLIDHEEEDVTIPHGNLLNTVKEGFLFLP